LAGPISSTTGRAAMPTLAAMIANLRTFLMSWSHLVLGTATACPRLTGHRT
jgi:hypothetical protein